jgi:DNA end-binding protein Ku
MRMRAIWKGAVAFGLVNVPVKLYAATGEHEVQLHQVHREDGGRIRYRRTCSVCGEEVTMADIAKGYETADGQMVVLTDEDFANLPLATEREIEVLEFVPAEQVDPILLARTYYLEPERTAAKAYTLLREALAATDRMAVVKVALRQRESMAVLRVRDQVICLQTLLWPDEIRAADFPILATEVSVRPQELAMASSLVESMASDFDPSEFSDSYATALQELIDAKVEAGTTVAVPVPAGAPTAAAGGGEVVDLLAALQRSVESARAGRAGGDGQAAGEPAEEEAKPARATRRRATGAGQPPAAEAEAEQAATGTSGGTRSRRGAPGRSAAATAADQEKPAARARRSTSANEAEAAPAAEAKPAGRRRAS